MYRAQILAISQGNVIWPNTLPPIPRSSAASPTSGSEGMDRVHVPCLHNWDSHVDPAWVCLEASVSQLGGERSTPSQEGERYPQALRLEKHPKCTPRLFQSHCPAPHPPHWVSQPNFHCYCKSPRQVKKNLFWSVVQKTQGQEVTVNNGFPAARDLRPTEHHLVR